MKMELASVYYRLRRRLHSRSGVILLIGLLVAAVALVTWLLLVVLADRNWQRLQQGGALRVAIDPSFPPFDTVDARGGVSGFDVDLARDLAQRIGVPIEFKSIAFDGLVDAIIAGKVDVVISAFPLDFPVHARHSLQPALFRSRAGTGGPGWQPDTDNCRSGRAQGGRGVGKPGRRLGREQGLDVLRLETPGDALNAAASGAAGAAIVDAVTAALSLPAGMQVRQPPLASEPYVIILPRRAGKLAEALDHALALALSDGTWERLARTYFPVPPAPPIIASAHTGAGDQYAGAWVNRDPSITSHPLPANRYPSGRTATRFSTLASSSRHAKRN